MASIEPTRNASPTARPLFVAGVPRSGTSAFTRYINRHPEVLVCLERYKYVPARDISPELFSVERILADHEGETNFPPQRYGKLIQAKDPARLSWVGDKYPHYVRHLRTLAQNNPGARFIVLYRPVEEVAESYQARASDPDDHWPAENGFDAGIDDWNRALRDSRDFVERTRRPEVLFVDYHRFFFDAESFIGLLGTFLEIEFDDRVRRSWARMSSAYAEQRRVKREPTAEQRSLVQERKDHEAERWVLDYIARQGEEGVTGSLWGRWRDELPGARRARAALGAE